MKIHKLLFAAAVAALGFSHVASATDIYISGAPAVRAAWNIAIYNTLVSISGSAGLTKYWSGGTTSTGYNSANQIVITGGTIGGTPVTIYGSWTGSTAGNQAVAISPAESNSALRVKFLKLSDLTTPGGGYTLGSGNLQYPQFTLSDSFQNTVPFHGHVTLTTPATDYVTLTEAPTHSPAITAYKFVTNKNAPARLNNITTNLARQLFTSAGVPLALFTGSNSDQATFVYPVGRDIGSGARYILLAETGIGTSHNDQISQFSPAVTTGTITDIVDNPSTSGTINLISFPTGNGGYSSFSFVSTVLSAVSTDAVGYAVSYVTDTDATSVIAAGGHELSWNGVYYGSTYEGAHGTAPASIAEGQYTFWSYLHVYYNLTQINTYYPLAKTFADALAADLATDTTTTAILTSDLSVSRISDGGQVTGNYY